MPGAKLSIGICAMDKKARSKPMYNLLKRLGSSGDFNIVIFGDNVILEDPIESWPSCDFLISFFSSGFPLNKAIRYVEETRPFCVNDLLMQQILWDRRLTCMVLDALDIKTPSRLVVNRDGGPPVLAETALKEILSREFNIYPNEDCFPEAPLLVLDYDTIQVGNKILKKPFVEKPVNGEDHNIYIYYPIAAGGGVCKLFRKIADKSSTFDPSIWHIRTEGSFIYEAYLHPEHHEDVKVYTIGPDHSYAETRKSPSFDGIVRRNANGKEVRFVTQLSERERQIARIVSMGFGQAVCGFDMVRCNGVSYVIDVNGWSFVKENCHYYDICAEELKKTFLRVSHRIPHFSLVKSANACNTKWSLKAHISVIRHGDRTPKRKLKVFLRRMYNFPSLFPVPATDVMLLGEKSLSTALLCTIDAISRQEHEEQAEKLICFKELLESKVSEPDTKLQIRKVSKSPFCLLVMLKWGGEFTHAARHQSIDLGDQLRNELGVLNRQIIDNFTVISSAERRVIATADTFIKSFLKLAEIPQDCININKEMLDDSYRGKEEIENCKESLRQLLSSDWTNEIIGNPSQFIRELVEIVNWHQKCFALRWPTINWCYQFTKWCCSDSPLTFRDRWQNIFANFSSTSCYDNSNAVNLYDCLKFDAIHNKALLEFLFREREEGSSVDSLAKLKALYTKAKVLFCFLAPKEYGISMVEKQSIGLKLTGQLWKSICKNLKAASDSSVKPFCKFYFTKESHLYTLVNLLYTLKMMTAAETTGERQKLEPEEELDYMSQITFEVYERKRGEFAFRVGISPGARPVTSILEIQDMNHTHTISTMPRVWISPYIPLERAIGEFEVLLAQK